MSNNLSEKINTLQIQDVTLLNNWNIVISILKEHHIARIVEIPPSIADKYKFDMYGLFLQELKIFPEQIYPHIRANGYDCSNSYDGSKLNIVMLDQSVLNNYYKLFTKK